MQPSFPNGVPAKSPRRRGPLHGELSVWLAVSLAVTVWLNPIRAEDLGFQSGVESNSPHPWTAVPAQKQTPGFSFTVFGDRTGMAYPQGIERALAKVNGVQSTPSAQSEFVISVGDNIEGYNRDASAVTRMWEDFDSRLRPFPIPFFRVPGNHDLSNPVMQKVYETRYGRPYYYFLYRDVLFLALNTDDPPGTLSEEQEKHLATVMDRIIAGAIATPDRVPEPLVKLGFCDPEAKPSAAYDPAARTGISAEQVAYFENVLARFPNVRWTFLLMHRPAWRQPQSSEFARLQKALGDRNYTVFAGHLHKFKHESIGGHEYYTLGPTAAIPRCADSPDDLNQIVNVQFDGPRPLVTREMLSHQ